MPQKQITFRIADEFIETSQKLKNYAICSDDDDPLFQFPISSEGAWNSYVYQQGLVRIAQMRKKFSKIMKEDEDYNTKPKR